MVINHGRCCCLCGRCNSHWVNCLYLFVVLYLFIYFILLHSLLFSFFIYLVFILSSELLSRTSSHTCGRWYLPTFLFRDGLLTLFYIDSFMNLMRFWSPPTILKLSSVVLWPVMLKWSNIGKGAFRCSLNLSPNVLEHSPSILHCIPPFHTCFYIWCHSSWLYGLYLWVQPGGLWWFCPPWSILYCHISYKHFCNSHWGLLHMEQLYSFSCCWKCCCWLTCSCCCYSYLML